MATRARARTLLLALGLAAPASGAPDPDPDAGARVVLLRESCDVAGQPLANCFESMEALADPATGWVWNVRSPGPGPDAPLLIDVGPGRFGPFTCDGGSHVSLRGAGRERSILYGDPNGTTIANCDELEFVGLGIHGLGVGVLWVGSGFSSWSDVDLVSLAGAGYARAAWYDLCLPGAERSVHYFHGSRVRTLGANIIVAGYLSGCGETWFYGGEVLWRIGGAGPTGSGAGAVLLQGNADFRAFGTSIRAVMESYVPGSATAVRTLPSATPGRPIFHAHGASIVASIGPGVDPGGGVPAPAVGIWAMDGFVHTPGTSFEVRAGDGADAWRVRSEPGAVVQSPFLWPAGPTPPGSPDETSALHSLDGQDLFVETDCSPAGDCAGGDEPHLMVYDAAACPLDPWFDLATGACRRTGPPQ